MYQPGHLGITTGVASAGTAYWLHRKFDEQPETDVDTFQKRLHRRGPQALKGVAAVAVADLASILVDRDLALGLGHRTVTHSVLTAGASGLTVRGIGTRIAGMTERAADTLGVPQQGQDLGNRIRENAGLYGTALAAGMGLHVLGDIPTGGVGGSALELLWPISSHAFNLGLVAAASPELNSLLLLSGLSIAAVSWASVCARILLPDEMWTTVREKIQSVKDRLVDAWVTAKEKATEVARTLLAKAKKVVLSLLGKDTSQHQTTRPENDVPLTSETQEKTPQAKNNTALRTESTDTNSEAVPLQVEGNTTNGTKDTPLISDLE